MKKALAFLLFFAYSVSMYTQESQTNDTDTIEPEDITRWTHSGSSSLHFNQAAFKHWAAGGENSISIAIRSAYSLHYKKSNVVWENDYTGNWGMQVVSKTAQKNEDELSIRSKFGYKLTDHLFFASLLHFKSQFTWGFNYPDEGAKVLISKFAAPAFLTAGLGIDWKPVDYFSMYVSPASGKFTFVRADARIDETIYGLEKGNIVRSEFGASLSTTFQKEIVKNVTLLSNLTLFNNYTDPDKSNRKNIDIDFKNQIDLHVNDWLKASIILHLIYDHNILVPIDDDNDGTFDRKAPRTQFMESFGLALFYAFGNSE